MLDCLFLVWCVFFVWFVACLLSCLLSCFFVLAVLVTRRTKGNEEDVLLFTCCQHRSQKTKGSPKFGANSMNRWRLCFRRERPEEKKGSKIGGSVPLVLQGTPYCTTYRSLNHDPTTYARWSKCESFLYVGKTRVHMLCEFVRRKCFVQRIKSPHIDSDANDP